MGNHSSFKVVTAQPESLPRVFNPVRLGRMLWTHRNLIRQLTWWDVASRYKGSYLGLLWSLLNPLLLLAIFTFVFSVIFQAKWGVSASESRLEFALTLFCGLAVFNFLSESLNRAPGAILAHPNYVKKTPFPLEIIPLANVLSALFHMLISLGILILGVLIFMRIFPWTLVFVPILLFFLLSLTLGLTWLISSLGVFIRDMNYAVGFLTAALLFLSPIFFPINAVPKDFQVIMLGNPLSAYMEASRRIFLWGQPPDWLWLGEVGLFSFAVLIFGYGFFMKSKRAFADVI